MMGWQWHQLDYMQPLTFHIDNNNRDDYELYAMRTWTRGMQR